MTFFYSLFFGAGVAGLAYNTFVRRVGYANTQNVAVVTGAIFVIATLVFYITLAWVLHI